VARERGGFWIGFCAVFFYPVGWLSARPRFVGLEHIPRTGGAVLAANHISHIDPIYSGLAVHLAGRVPRFLAKDSLWRVPVLGTVLRSTGQIPVFRGSADAQASLREGTAALEKGKVLVVYPEGTISRDPAHWPMHPRTGVARLALASDAPVLTLEQMTALQAHVDALVAEASQPGCGPMIAAARARGDVTQYEIDRMVGIANRESHCFLGAHNYSTRTRDDSWGPFQINYYGALRARAVTIGSPESNTWSWAQAVDNMLKLARGSGWCHWTPGSYCS